jgi:hypothetical protein
MKTVLLTIILILSTSLAFSQIIQSDSICNNDIFLVPGFLTYPESYPLSDPRALVEAKYCDYKTDFGASFEFGFSQYFHDNSVRNWIGFHQGTNLNFALVYRIISLGFRFKPWTTPVKSELNFNNVILPIDTDINPMKIDSYLGIAINLNEKYYIEPTFGYSRCFFDFPYAVDIRDKILIKGNGGPLIGITFNRYIDLNNYSFFSVYCRINHGFVDYARTHSLLIGGYTEINIGVSYKFYRKIRKYRAISINKA